MDDADLQFLDPGKRRSLAEAQARYRQAMDDLDAVADADQRRDLELAAEKALEEATAAALSPEERLQLEYRTSPLAEDLREKLRGFGASREEFEQLFRLESDFAKEREALEQAGAPRHRSPVAGQDRSGRNPARGSHRQGPRPGTIRRVRADPRPGFPDALRSRPTARHAPDRGPRGLGHAPDGGPTHGDHPQQPSPHPRPETRRTRSRPRRNPVRHRRGPGRTPVARVPATRRSLARRTHRPRARRPAPRRRRSRRSKSKARPCRPLPGVVPFQPVPFQPVPLQPIPILPAP
jgi:hypothetical protein